MSALPDFAIIGGQKCGTTAAARNLSLHPKIRVFSGVTEYGQKEIEFFNQHWNRGIDWYKSHFTNDGVLNGDKTAELLHRKICHERMHAINPNFRLVVLLRSPVERAYSQWKMAALHKRDEPEEFEEIIHREIAMLGNCCSDDAFYNCQRHDISSWREGYLLKGMYADQLQSVYKWFPKDHVFIGIAERIRQDMLVGYSQMFEFLDLEPLHGPFSEHFIGRPGPPMAAGVRALVSEIYRVPNERLFSLLGEEVPEWT